MGKWGKERERITKIRKERENGVSKDKSKIRDIKETQSNKNRKRKIIMSIKKKK